METNSNAEPDAPLPPPEPLSTASAGQTLPPGEPPEASQEGAAAAAAEGLPEPMAELAAESNPEIAAPPASTDTADEASGNEEQPETDTSTPSDEAESFETGEETAEEDAGEPSAEGTEENALAALADQAQQARLSPEDEERAVALLKEALLKGRVGVACAIEALPKLPWMIGVSAVGAVWPELKPVFRTQLLAGLGKEDTDSARRIRLSLARGLFKQDIPVALKIATAVAKEMRDKETGALSPKNAQIFANVFIGRAKPWIGQLSLDELKAADADLLVHCAVVSAFSVPHAPITQLGVLKWAAESNRLTKLQDVALELAARGLSRWSAKWQGVLRKEVAELPEALVAVLRPVSAPAEPASAETPEPDSDTTPTPETAEDSEEGLQEPPDVDEEDEDEDEEEPDAEPAETPKEETRYEERGGTSESGPRPRPVYESKTIPKKSQQQQQQQPAQYQGGKSGGFNLSEVLRQIESHVSQLRSELQGAQNKLRQRDDETRKSGKRGGDRGDRGDRAAAPIIPGEPTPDELARLNQQLEARNAELQQRIHELTVDSEDRAASMGAHSDAPVTQPDAQLRTLLAFKLHEDFEDFLALEQESPDVVVQQHYRTVLRHVFEVLQQEGVQLSAPKEDEENGG